MRVSCAKLKHFPSLFLEFGITLSLTYIIRVRTIPQPVAGFLP